MLQVHAVVSQDCRLLVISVKGWPEIHLSRVGLEVNESLSLFCELCKEKLVHMHLPGKRCQANCVTLPAAEPRSTTF